MCIVRKTRFPVEAGPTSVSLDDLGSAFPCLPMLSKRSANCPSVASNRVLYEGMISGMVQAGYRTDHECADHRHFYLLVSKVTGLAKSPVIAVVDDDTAVRTGIDSLVRSLGFVACLFASAEEFLISSCLKNTDCLITDVQMPGMSGVELHEHLSNQGMHIPTIFITAFPEEAVRKRAMTGSAVGFLSKPFNAQVLIDCIESTLPVA